MRALLCLLAMGWLLSLETLPTGECGRVAVYEVVPAASIRLGRRAGLGSP
jgi:hypothetical protein